MGRSDFRYVARKISRAKWQTTGSGGEPRGAPADAVTACLRTGQNRLSLWRFTDPMQDLGEVALAMAANAERAETFDLVWLSAETLSLYEQEETEGKTAVKDLRDRHIDVCRLDGRGLVAIADHFFVAVQKNEVRRFREKEVIALVQTALRDGRIAPSDLPEKLRAQVITNDP